MNGKKEKRCSPWKWMIERKKNKTIFTKTWNPLDFFWLIICCRSPAAATVAGAPVITFAIPSYIQRNEHARLLIVAKALYFFRCLSLSLSAATSRNVGTLSCIFKTRHLYFPTINANIWESLICTHSLSPIQCSSSKLRALKIIVIIYVDKFSNIKAHGEFLRWIE